MAKSPAGDHPEGTSEHTTAPRFAEALRFWTKLGLISFGGPAGQIAIMHTELVEKRRWVSEGRFLHALNFCMVLPGPEAQQLATYLGWALHGIKGGVAAGVLFILPAAVLLWALSWLAMAGGAQPAVSAIFYGLQPAVVAIIAAAVLRIGKKTLKSPFLAALAVVAFVAIFFFQVSFLVLVTAAAAAGLAVGRLRPGWVPTESHGAAEAEPPEVRKGAPLRTAAVCLTLWVTPVVVVCDVFGVSSVFGQLGLFFSKAALITFGGAYAVLPYVAQQAVHHHGWLTTPQMMSGLALAETTPGPLIMVLQYVGFAAAWQQPGHLPPLLAATFGAAITTWVTFLPSFLFVLTGAPYVERLRQVRALTNALTGLTAAVVGVILNLAVWFTGHMLFPRPGTIDPIALLLAIEFFLLLWKGRASVPIVIASGAVAGLVFKLWFGW
jgi:chromate transporter